MIDKIPVLESIVRIIKWKRLVLGRFRGSEDYWIQRYKLGKNSGVGSYENFAIFKAEVLNGFVAENNIATVIEYGCGDGNQLKLANYPQYVGFDVSPEAIARCKEMFRNDATKSFKLMKDYAGETAELTLSLDVIFHLVEDEIFHAYKERLFDSSERFVIIYSSNEAVPRSETASHVRHRVFTRWVEEHRPEWELFRHIPNRYPYRGNYRTGSRSDFYFYRKHLESAAGSKR